ncbi:hypothetical protein G9A89_020989 [Geosiphon pyriformis]|nr:hypothetical protein G9A89_020989 [Geosiphon pyriformis]
MKKTAKVSGSNDSFKPVLPRKKRRSGALEDSFSDKIVGSEGSRTGDTTESNSIDMEEKCLVEETSFRQESREESGGIDTDMMPKSPKRIVTKHTLGKFFGTINFGMENNDDDNILDGLLSLSSSLSLKHMVQVSVRKSFALDINLGMVADKSSQEKLAYVKKNFSGVNGFGRAFTPSKFGEIIRTSFTSDEAMMAAAKLANDCDVAIVLKEIPVGTSVETVHMAVSKFGQKVIIELENQNQADLADINKQSWNVQDSFRVLLYTFLMETTAHDFYFHAHCATVCFNSESDLVGATPVIKGVSLYWSHLSQASCAVCKSFGYTSLNCWSIKDAVALGSRKAPLLVQDQFRLARIYVKKSAPISCSLAFGGKTWALVVGAPSVHASHGAGMSLGFNKIGELLSPVVNDLELHLVGIENSLVSLAGQISELAKRLESLVLAVSQPSSGWENIMMGVGSGEATSNKIVPIVDSTASPHVVKLEKILDGLFRSVLSLSAYFNSLALADGMNIPTKQDNIVRWHKDMNNLVLIFMETKLKNKARAGIVIVMNRSLARYVYKISKVLGCLLCIRLLFKNKLLVSILDLYTGASLATQFSQANEVNFLIARAVNESSFVILGGDFNEDGFCKCASFKKCHDLGLVNSLDGSSFAKVLTWSNSQGVSKMIDYVFVSSNLVNAIMQCGVFVVSKHFDMDYRAVSVSLGLGGLLDTRLNSLCKQANKDQWKFNFKSADEIK